MVKIPSIVVPTNKRASRQQDLDSQIGRPVKSSLNISYGTIHEIEEGLQVRVRLLNENGNFGEVLGGVSNKFFIPLMNQEDDVNLRWGELRIGLTLRIWWRGEDILTGAPIAEIIGDENGNNFLKKIPVEQTEPGSYKLVAPGMIIA